MDSSSIDWDTFSELEKSLVQELGKQQFALAKVSLDQMVQMIPGTKKIATELKNSLTSVASALASDDLTKKAAAEYVASYYAAFNSKLAAFLSSIKTADDAKSDSHDDGFALSQKILDKHSDSEAALKSELLKKGYVFTKAPVVVIATPFFNPAELRRNGFNVDAFEGYFILKDQYVAGVTNEYAAQRIADAAVAGSSGKENALGLTKDQAKKFLKEERDAKTQKKIKDAELHVLDDLVDTIKGKYAAQRFQDLGPKFGWYNARWCWLVPSGQVTLLSRSTVAGSSGGHLKVKNVSFPFYRSGVK
jgi:hypothetical protein